MTTTRRHITSTTVRELDRRTVCALRDIAIEAIEVTDNAATFSGSPQAAANAVNDGLGEYFRDMGRKATARELDAMRSLHALQDRLQSAANYGLPAFAIEVTR